ncbi:MAG: hypothetical protein P8P74_03690 [Crocinitomicaceae bacterium]|nr:hypothetical protein [Crocinitomicaceae bacterium]
MSAIDDMVSVLSAEERVQFVRYLKDRNRRNDARNIELFQALLRGNEDALKRKMGSNAYNVLRNRLKHRMIDFIAESTIRKEGSAEDQLTKGFITAKRLMKQGKTDAAFKLLLKIESNAHELENYTLEGEVQQLLIEHAHASGAPNLEDLFTRSNENLQLQQVRTQLNLAYARIRLAYQDRAFQGEQVDLADLLQTTFKEFSVSDEVAFSFSSLNQLVQIYDIYGAYSKNYHEINLFFIDKLREIQGGKNDTEQNLHYHIEILYAVANIYFRRKDFETSLAFLEEMKEQMNRFDGKYNQQYRIKRNMLAALNLNHTGRKEEARVLIEAALDQKHTSDDTIQIRLALAMLQFQQGELRECQRTLSKLSRTDAWYEKNLGIEWTLHKLTIEILLHIDLENYEYAESRLKSLLRKHRSFLNAEGRNQARPFLRLVQVILKEPTAVVENKFHEQVESSIQWKTAEEEDIFSMNFYAWLKAKMTGKGVYSTLLELLSSH